ncbi:nudix hydrolase 20, chloroplastic-like isoform X2 [Benincasa hispida]|uniref:nudix hydrolase 20, chloroplastic-like isoform X2 n=1 Tax=Benincasa hispida TaxID=102211 RepID=UPI0019013330|nr:nudix hydrolase 20, chloroplastic-like isoform X2 [Benincasa hispida]XP_038879264.1 nudix hydrolase 20, chloroplastic-like isoform X2 [Benincasa hispida]
MAYKSMATHSFRNFSTVSSFCNASTISRTTYPMTSTFRPTLLHSISVASRSVSVAAGSFTWDDVVHVSLPESFQDDPSDLTGYFEKVKLCNRGSDTQSEILPFVIDDQIVGYVHHGFAKHLKQYPNVFTFPRDDSVKFGAYLTLHESLKTPKDRTLAVGDVVKCLGEKVIPGTRNELYPVTSSFGAPNFFSLERAAAPYFGIKVYGVHMNGYVEKEGKKFLWVAKRSQTKPTFPGMLDHLVAGGLMVSEHGDENVAGIEEIQSSTLVRDGTPRENSNSAEIRATVDQYLRSLLGPIQIQPALIDPAVIVVVAVGGPPPLPTTTSTTLPPLPSRLDHPPLAQPRYECPPSTSYVFQPRGFTAADSAPDPTGGSVSASGHPLWGEPDERM